MFHPTEHSYAKKKKNRKFWTWRYSFLIDRYDHAVVILGRIKLFVIAVEKTTAGRLQQLQRGGRLVGLKDFR